MSIFDVTPSHISKMRKGTSDSPYVSVEETRQVVGNIVILREIPNKFEKVNVKDSQGNDLYEVEGSPQSPSEYKVDYDTGVVNFTSDNNDEEFIFEYQGVGLTFINFARIFTSYTPDEIVTTLEDNLEDALDSIDNVYSAINDAIEATQSAIETNDEARDLIEELEQLKLDTEDARQDAIAAANNANDQADYAESQGNYAKDQGNYAKDQGDYAQEEADRAKGEADRLENVSLDSHKVEDEPHRYGDRFSFKYNSTTDTLDLVVY